MNEMEIAQRCRDTMWNGDRASQEMGMSVVVTGPGCAEANFEVRSDMLNGHGICHGGYIFALADSAFAFACNSYNRLTVAAAASIEFVRPGRLGDRLTASASEIHRGRRTGIYDVTVSDQDANLVAIFRGRAHATGERLLESDTENIEK